MNKFSTEYCINVKKKSYVIHRLHPLEKINGVKISALPYSIRILLENLLRNMDGQIITGEDVLNLARWSQPDEPVSGEMAWYPSRVVMQDFTGLPAALDLAVLRDKVMQSGGNADDINPAVPADIIIDHSLRIQSTGTEHSLKENTDREFSMNRERFSFLKWAGKSFRNLSIFPPGTGIIHQVNLEYIAGVIAVDEHQAFPETLIGTDSHTTMINGIGIPGWGVGGIEAEAVLLGQPNYIKIPRVTGVHLCGKLNPGVTATDLALTITQFLRSKDVVESFVEFHGEGIKSLTIPDRATVANMAPEYGATMGYFPVDKKVIEYLKSTDRKQSAELVEICFKEQRLFYDPSEQPVYSRELEFDLSTVERSVAGPSRPQDRIALSQLKERHNDSTVKNDKKELADGSIVIASITSCTNTSNPFLMLAAGLLAQKACERGLTVPDYVKTSMVPGSRAVEGYLNKAGLLPFLQQLGFHIAGFGCGVCVGNSGSLLAGVADEVNEKKINVASVLSGNRNFEARIHPLVSENFLASPPLVVAFAIAGTVRIDLDSEPLGIGSDGEMVFLKDVWPDNEEISKVVLDALKSDEGEFRATYEQAMQGDRNWQQLEMPKGDIFQWEKGSTYVRPVPFFNAPAGENAGDINEARALLVLGDSITTDHISPVSAIPNGSPAGNYLEKHGVAPEQFNTYGARRGDHEVMARGTFTNVRLKNQLVEPKMGGWTIVFSHSDKKPVPVFEAAQVYRKQAIPVIVFGGKDYGMGSARDWAAKGTMMLGIKAVIAKSFERIHRSNLVGMGVLPLQFVNGESFDSLGLIGNEIFSIKDIIAISPGKELTVEVREIAVEEPVKNFIVRARLDTPKEVEYYRHGGILPFVFAGI